MAAQNPPYAIQASSHSAELFRRAVGSLLNTTGGIVDPTDLAVSQNGTPNMSVNVAAGQVWIPGSVGANQGMYYGLNDAAVNLAISASSPSNPRIDIVCATVQDAAYSGSSNQWVLQVITGTPAASPVAPSAPSSSFLLAQIAVAANATSITTGNITDLRVRAQLEPSINYGGLLAFKRISSTNWSVNSGTYVVANSAGNITFTAPPSGQVLIEESTLFNNGAASVRGLLQWSNGSVNNTNMVGELARTGNIDSTGHRTLQHFVGSLTPGAVYTLYLQVAYYNASGAVVIGDSVSHPLIITVRAV